MINAVNNKVPNWIINVPYTETGQFDPELVNEVLSMSILTRKARPCDGSHEMTLQAVVSKGTHPMHLFPGATWRRAEGEIFEDDRFGPHVVEEFTLQPILGVARPWCTGLHGEPLQQVLEEMRDKVYSLLFDQACQKAGQSGLSSQVRHRLSTMLHKACSLIDPFHLEDHQVERMVERTVKAALEQPVVASMNLPWSPNELEDGKLYGLSIPLTNPERELWLDFRVAADELIQAWPDKSEEVSRVTRDLQTRLLGSPLPVLPSGLRFGSNLEEFEEALWKDLLSLRDLCDEVSSAGEDAEYLLDELRKTVHQIIALRRYRFTPKWDLLVRIFEEMPADRKKKLGIVSHLYSSGVGKAIQKASCDFGLAAYDWSVTSLNAIRKDTLWTLLDSDTLMKCPDYLLKNVTSPVLVILYDLEWEWLGQSGEIDLSQFQIQKISMATDTMELPHPQPGITDLPLAIVRPLHTDKPPVPAEETNTSTLHYQVVFGNHHVLHLSERSRVWVRPKRGDVEEKLVRHLSPGDLVITRKQDKVLLIYQKVCEALQPDLIKQFQQEICNRMKDLGITNREVWRRMLNAQCEIYSENEVSLWRTGRTWGPRRGEDLEKLAEILASSWLRDHWRDLAEILQAKNDELKYKRITHSLLKKSARHSPHWNETEKSILSKAGLTIDHLRDCLVFSGVVSVKVESMATAA